MGLNQKCANPNCIKHLEKRGGQFVYSKERNAWFCEDCFKYGDMVMNGAKNLWDFTTTHFNGEKVHVRSLSHLRELEKQYGCSSHAANHMEKQWGVPPSVRENTQVIPREHMPSGSFRPEERR